MYKTIEDLKKGDFVYEASYREDIYKGEVEKVTMYHTVVIVKIKGLYKDRGYGYVSGIKGHWHLNGTGEERFYTDIDLAKKYRDHLSRIKTYGMIKYHIESLQDCGIKMTISL